MLIYIIEKIRVIQTNFTAGDASSRIQNFPEGMSILK